MMHNKQECIDHHLWHKNLMVAFWLIVILVNYLAWFTDALILTMFAFLVALLLFWVRLRIDRKHYEWHLGQEREEDHSM